MTILGGASWIKANPSWGQAVHRMPSAPSWCKLGNNPAQEAAAKSRHLNVWVSADEALFSMRSWRECARSKIGLEDFEGQACHVGSILPAGPTSRPL